MSMTASDQMVPSTSRNGTTGKTPMRQSCDRCHSQKLRCTRASTNNNTGACGRCLAKRVKCIYSFSLPKGRPSVYHLADQSTGTLSGRGRGSGSGSRSRNGDGSAAESAAGNTASSDRRLSTTALTPLTLPATPATPVSSQTRSAESYANVNANANANAHSRHHTMSDDSIFSPKIGDTPTDVSTEPWPWFESLTWDDLATEMPGNGSGPDSNQSTFNWHTIMDSSPTFASDSDSTAYLAAFPGLRDRASTGHDAGADGNDTAPAYLPRLHTHVDGQGLEISYSEERSSFSTSGGNVGGANSSIVDPDAVIAELCQLSSRLSPLRQSLSSYPSKDHSQDHQKPLLIDDATVESVAAWLVHGSANRNLLFPQDPPLRAAETKTTGNVLYHLFSASQHLLEILRHMQGNTGDTKTPSLSKSIDSTPSPVDSIHSAHFGLHAGPESSSYSLQSNHHSNNVIRNLLIACHTMLLNIYVSVLKTLEHDANTIDHAGAAALGDIGLVSIVQLCSYLTVRQHQAIGMCLSAQSPPAISPWQEHVASNQGFQLYPDAATGEEMLGLKMEVQQRLARLQQTLCF